MTPPAAPPPAAPPPAARPPDTVGPAPHWFVVPQWQGSSVSTAEEMAAGADLVAEVLQASPSRTDTPRGDAVEPETVSAPDLPRGGAAVAAVRQVLSRMLADVDPSAPIRLVGGDCSVDAAALERSLRDPGVRVVWFDAHADANTVMSSPSGAAHGMVARTALAESPERLVYVGTRAFDPEERRWIAEHAIPVLPIDAGADQLREAVGAATAVHVHLDLDVLDPGWFAGAALPEPYGMRPPALVELLATLAGGYDLRCVTVTECVPPAKAKRLAADRAVLTDLAAALAC